MKKMLKKIMVLVVAATLFVMPASSVLAETIPVCTSYGPDSAVYKYEPGPYILHGGYSIILHNYNNPSQTWDVKAGKKVIFEVDTKYLGPVSGKLVIMDSNGSTVASNQFTTGADSYCIQITLPPLSTNKQYTMMLIAYTDIFIDEYLYVQYTP